MASPATYQDFLAAQEMLKYPTNPTQLSAFKILFSDPSIPIS
jgi:hypothetical protein